MINTDDILNLLEEEIGTLMNKNPSFYDGYTIKLELEEQFDFSILEENSNYIYVVINLLEGSLPYGQVVLPINFSIVSERNNIAVAQKLFFDFAQEYNLKLSSDGNIRQYYTTPSLSSAFDEEGDGFRSIFSMSASFLITENILDVEKLEYQKSDGTLEQVKIISYIPNYQAQIDAQAFEKNDSKIESVGMIGTIVFNFTCYLTNNELFNNLLNIMYKNGSVNQDFYFKITFTNGFESGILKYKLVDFSPSFMLGEIPTCSITFSR